MANTYELIESYTVGAGGIGAITLGSGGTIPQTYKDLVIKLSSRTTRVDTVDDIFLSFNGNNSNAYYIQMYGNGSTASGGSSTSLYFGPTNAANSTSTIFARGEMYIPNYTLSQVKSAHISWATEGNITGCYVGATYTRWNNTSAITSVTLTPNNSFVQYTTAYLYGIK